MGGGMAEYANYVGLFLSMSGFMFIWFVRGAEHWRGVVLLTGLLLVAIATLSFASFNGLNVVSDLYLSKHKISEIGHAEAKVVTNMWLYVLPAVLGAIGANFISAWALSKKPAE